jgi:divalent metal cation (Fe/Co/Zn/Cd) transporter
MTISDLVDAGQGYVAGYTPSPSPHPSPDTEKQVDATASHSAQHLNQASWNRRRGRESYPVSSAGALLGLIGVAAGLPWADGVAGLIVTGFIVPVGWEVTSEIVVHLMDGVDPQLLASAEAAALQVPGVEHVHARARWIGRSLIVDIQGFMADSTPLGTADELGQQVRTAVTASIPEARAVLWSPHGLPA